MIFTIIASCRQHGLDPFEYLRDLLTALPSATTSQVVEFTPATWAKRLTQHRLKISAREYLLDVLPRLANGTTGDVPSVTPKAWAATRQA